MAVIETRMNFLPSWTDDNGDPYVRGTPSEGFAKSNFEQQEHCVKITDARPFITDFGLDTHAFAYHYDNTVSEELLKAVRSGDVQKIENEYVPLVEKLVMQKTGASKVVVFDHTVRKREPDSTAKYDGEVKIKKAMQPAGLVRGNPTIRRTVLDSLIACSPFKVMPYRGMAPCFENKL